jgi:flagellar biosynthesis protein FlhB
VKRHPPSSRKLREARRRGEVPAARLLPGLAALVAGSAVLEASGAGAARALSGALRQAVAAACAATGAAVAPWPATAAALDLVARTALPIGAAAALGAMGVGLLQNRGLFAPGALRFRLDRLHPGAGLRRLLSAERLLEVGLHASAALAALLTGAWLLAHGSAVLLAVPLLDAAGLQAALAAVARRVALPLGAILAGFGLAELLHAQAAYRRRLMMTRLELERERREDEGEPRLRAERRRLHRALSAAGALRQATCLVVNPSHVAVALLHDRAAEEAPVVIAKGIGLAAARLRVQARLAGVPIVRDPALARALVRLAEVGDAVPEELYVAAAVVLAHVYARRRGDAHGEARP